jgi:hypothetical protein
VSISLNRPTGVGVRPKRHSAEKRQLVLTPGRTRQGHRLFSLRSRRPSFRCECRTRKSRRTSMGSIEWVVVIAPRQASSRCCDHLQRDVRSAIGVCAASKAVWPPRRRYVRSHFLVREPVRERSRLADSTCYEINVKQAAAQIACSDDLWLRVRAAS